MNNERRKALQAFIGRIEEAQANLDEIRSELETLRDEEQDYYDNMPESFQNGEKGERATAAVDAINEAIDTLENFDFEAVTGGIETACE